MWPQVYAVSVAPTFWRFFAHTILSTFNVPGSGIVSAAIGPGLLQVLAILLLGSTSVAGVVGLVRTIRGRYEKRAQEVVKEVKSGIRSFESRFRKHFGMPMRAYLQQLEAASGQFTEFVLSVVRALDAFEDPEATTGPHPRKGSRARRGR